jgi:GH24 family phage-related lysozyme (muramidase)
MKTGQEGLDLIKFFEGFRQDAYQDVVGIWTIGYGTIRYPDGTPVKKGDHCSLEQAEHYLAHELGKFEDQINKLVKVQLNQNQFDALACFCYNVGGGAFAKSTLLKKLNAQDYPGAAQQFLVWNKAGGKPVAGLTKRRQAESNLFQKA